MIDNFIFFVIYSVALVCVSFLLGAVWQDRRLLKTLEPPPLPIQPKMEPPPVNKPQVSVSPFAPKPKPQQSTKAKYQQYIAEAINKRRAEKAANSPPTPSSASLPDIPWGS